jgi:hypothetical protein
VERHGKLLAQLDIAHDFDKRMRALLGPDPNSADR